MRVSNIEIVELDDACQLQALVESDLDPDDARWLEPFVLWYRFPVWCRPHLSVENGDPFLAALLVGAMRTQEGLAIAAPCSPCCPTSKPSTTPSSRAPRRFSSRPPRAKRRPL